MYSSNISAGVRRDRRRRITSWPVFSLTLLTAVRQRRRMGPLSIAQIYRPTQRVTHKSRVNWIVRRTRISSVISLIENIVGFLFHKPDNVDHWSSQISMSFFYIFIYLVDFGIALDSIGLCTLVGDTYTLINAQRSGGVFSKWNLISAVSVSSFSFLFFTSPILFISGFTPAGILSEPGLLDNRGSFHFYSLLRCTHFHGRIYMYIQTTTTKTLKMTQSTI